MVNIKRQAIKYTVLIFMYLFFFWLCAAWFSVCFFCYSPCFFFRYYSVCNLR